MLRCGMAGRVARRELLPFEAAIGTLRARRRKCGAIVGNAYGAALAAPTRL